MYLTQPFGQTIPHGLRDDHRSRDAMVIREQQKDVRDLALCRMPFRGDGENEGQRQHYEPRQWAVGAESEKLRDDAPNSDRPPCLSDVPVLDGAL